MYYDTRTMILEQDDFSFPGDKEFDWSKEQIQFLINLAISKSDMEIDTQTKFKNFGVSEVVKGIIYSKVAYIESESGYFIISEDMLLHLTVTYSRWD